MIPRPYGDYAANESLGTPYAAWRCFACEQWWECAFKLWPFGNIDMHDPQLRLDVWEAAYNRCFGSKS
jgi:hypothetical protein